MMRDMLISIIGSLIGSGATLMVHTPFVVTGMVWIVIACMVAVCMGIHEKRKVLYPEA